MPPNLAPIDRLLDLLAEAVVRERLEELVAKEYPRADASHRESPCAPLAAAP